VSAELCVVEGVGVCDSTTNFGFVLGFVCVDIFDRLSDFWKRLVSFLFEVLSLSTAPWFGMNSISVTKLCKALGKAQGA